MSEVNTEGKIPTIRKTARMILIPKPGKHLALLFSFRPISVLLAHSKVCEDTFETFIENWSAIDALYRVNERI